MVRLLLYALALTLGVQATPISLESRGQGDTELHWSVLVEGATIMNKDLTALGQTNDFLFALSGGASMYFLDTDTREWRRSGDLDWTVSGRNRADGLKVEQYLLKHDRERYKWGSRAGNSFEELFFISDEEIKVKKQTKRIEIPTAARIGEANKPLKQLRSEKQILHINGVNILHPVVQINKKCDAYMTPTRKSRAKQDEDDVETLVNWLSHNEAGTRYTADQFDQRCFTFSKLARHLQRLGVTGPSTSTNQGSSSQGKPGSSSQGKPGSSSQGNTHAPTTEQGTSSQGNIHRPPTQQGATQSNRPSTQQVTQGNRPPSTQ